MEPQEWQPRVLRNPNTGDPTDSVQSNDPTVGDVADSVGQVGETIGQAGRFAGRALDPVLPDPEPVPEPEGISARQIDAQLDAQDQRVRLYKQNRALAEKEADIAMKLNMPAGADVDRKLLSKAATKHVPAFNSSVSMLNTLSDMERVYNASPVSGMGAVSSALSAFTRLFGGTDLTMARHQAELQLKRIAATDAARSFDSKQEGDRLARTIPGLEAQPHEFMKWLHDTQRYMSKVAQAASDSLDIAGHPAITQTLLQDSMPQLEAYKRSAVRTGARAAQ